MAQEQNVPQQCDTTDAQRIAYNAKYCASLESIVRSAMDDYNHTTYTLKSFQHSTIKTYLWISTVVFAAELAFYADVSGSNTLISFIGMEINIQSKIFKALSSLSLMLSMAVFILGVDTMRGRNSTSSPTSHGWLALSNMAYADCDEDYRDNYRIALIQDISNAITSHLKESNSRGKKLRCMSWGILASVGCAILTLLC
ncbi:hypothetical protein [Nitratidesulfovibrio sp. 1201_IL3209]|uniref:hypothetical protein n=1 Tax=Nitratidesulfovibrio sp. 1201_IL3209 TaxID=3084053 RepID=UPI002FD88032